MRAEHLKMSGMKSLIFRLSQYLPELMSIRNKTADPMNVIKMLSGHNQSWVLGDITECSQLQLVV